ncbi:MAG: DUF349 domain-containing protein [Bacteroidales bacterium]
MENKDQLNQIPGESNRETQDEKTSNTENQNVEASHVEEANTSEEERKKSSETRPDESPAGAAEEQENKEQPEETTGPASSEVEPATAETPEKEQAGEPEAVKEEETEKPEEQSAPEVAEEQPEPAPLTEKEEQTEKLSDEQEGEDEDDEDEEHHEVEEEGIIDYDQLSRTQLVDKLEELVQEDDVNRIKSRVALIKVAYLKKTKEEKEANYQEHLEIQEEKEEKEDKEEKEEKEQAAVPVDETGQRFNALFDIYRQKRAVYLENLEKEKLVNLDKKKEILDQLKELINSEETLKKTYDEFRELQENWRNIGMVPKGEVNNLWQSYHFLVEKFFDKVKINKELKDLDLKKNLEQKIELCEKAEELLLETSIIKSFKQLQRYHEQWKNIGPVPEDKKDELWERFKSTTDKINQRRREHYKKLQEEQENNLVAKQALCEKADTLLSQEVNTIRQWQEKTKQFNELFKVWKTIGPAPKKQNDEIWDRFKTALDTFFADKKEYFGKLKEQQVNNYNLKLDLCVQAEAMQDSTDWRNSTRDLIEMQKEWKKIGPVPRKHSDKLWARFRAACDHFFNRKAEHFASIRGEETDNLKKKEDIIRQVEEYNFEGNKSDSLAILKDFQRQWTEIGHVPFKEKDRLQNAFRNAINKQLDKLNISNSEMTLASYKSKMEVIKGASDGDRQLYRERSFIQNKINKLREDIMLWENNIGFLAHSKKANLLKVEFEKKIEKAKSEVSVLETKLKILND